MNDGSQRILIVSDDDICLAPLVAAVLRTEIGDRAEVDVATAGTRAETGSSVCATAASRIPDAGALSGHRSRSINADLVRRAGLVLVMTVEQREHINRVAPGRQRAVFTLREALGLALSEGADAWSGDETIEEFAETLHRRRGLVTPRRLTVPRRGLLRRPVAVIEVDDLLDGHLLDGESHRWATAQARTAAVRLGDTLRGRRGVARAA